MTSRFSGAAGVDHRGRDALGADASTLFGASDAQPIFSLHGVLGKG